MDYRYLKTFLITAELKSFSKASLKLGIAQSAISRQIKLLEESMGNPLIIRTSSKFSLTLDGEKLLKELENFEKSIHLIINKEQTTSLRIGIVHGVLENWLLKKVRCLRARFHTHLQLYIDNPDELGKGLLQSHFDLIISTENIQNEGITSLKLFDEKLYLISCKPIQMKELHKDPWIVYGSKDWFFKFFKNQSNSIIEVNSITAILKLVEYSQGISIIPEHMIPADSKLYIKPLESEIIGNTINSIYLSTLNYKKIPQYLADAIKILKT